MPKSARGSGLNRPFGPLSAAKPHIVRRIEKLTQHQRVSVFTLIANLCIMEIVGIRGLSRIGRLKGYNK